MTKKFQVCTPSVTVCVEPLIDGQLSGSRPVVGTEAMELVDVGPDPDVIEMVVVTADTAPTLAPTLALMIVNAVL